MADTSVPASNDATSNATEANIDNSTNNNTTSSSSVTTTTSLFSGLQAVASNVNKGIRAIGTGIDTNLKDATANFVNVNTNIIQSINTSLTGQVSSVPIPIADRSQSQTNELIYRTRDLHKSTDNVAQQFLTREVDVANASISSYTKTMKEIHNSKLVLRPLHDSVGSLATSVGNARIVAAKLVNKVQ